MIDPLLALHRQVRVFIETELFGLMEWGNNVKFDPPEKSEREVDRDGNPIKGREGGRVGRWKEHAIARFSGYALEISSPNQQPPLGLIKLHGPSDRFGGMPMVLVEGAMGPETWGKVAAHLKRALATEDANHGGR